MSQTIFFPGERERMSPHVVVQIGCGSDCKGATAKVPEPVRPATLARRAVRRPSGPLACGAQMLQAGHQPIPCGVKVPTRDGRADTTADVIRRMAQAVALGGGEAPGGYLGTKGSGVQS